MATWFFILVMLLVKAIFFVYFYLKRKYSFWSDRGVDGPAPSIFGLGNMLQLMRDGEHTRLESELTRRYGPIYGTYTGLEPVLTITDAELIKQVLVKDFHHFVNRRILRTHSPIRTVNQFVADGDDWKRIRSITSPSFTTGKLRQMHPMMSRCVDKFVDHLDRVCETNGGKLEVRENSINFTLTVIASTSFAMDIPVAGNREHPLIKAALEFVSIHPLKALSAFAMPRWFNRLVGIEHMFNANSYRYLVKLMKEILKNRLAITAKSSGNETKQKDLLQLLIDAYTYEDSLREANDYRHLTAGIDSNEKDDDDDLVSSSLNDKKLIKKLSEVEIIAQSILFFNAGFETTATTLSNCLFELAQNAPIQDRLRRELDEALSASNRPDRLASEYYDIIMRQPYLDAVIKEALRKYPPLNRIERRLGIDNYEIAGIKLMRDQLIEICTNAVHYKPEYYPDPYRYDPERFLPENRDRLTPYTYLPFGDGPRNCVGMRFAYQEIKLCLAAIIARYRFSPTIETPKTLQFDGYKFVSGSKSFSIKVERL